MAGMGTIVNVAAIIAGGILGLVLQRFLKERYQETILKGMGFAVIVMAIASTMSQMLAVSPGAEAGSYALSTKGTMMMIISIAIGGFVGEFIDLDSKFERFGIWLREKSNSQNDSKFVDAFVTSSLTVCVGAMAIIGSIQDGILADHSTLYAKATLDLVIIMMMAVSMGKGCIFSAIPVGILQGSITILATFLAPIMTDAALSNISLVGNVLILCVGVNIVWPKTIRVANVLPALVFAAAASFLPI